MTVYELLGISESADWVEVQEAFTAKKHEWQEQMVSSKDPVMRKEATANLGELVKAYGEEKKRRCSMTDSDQKEMKASISASSPKPDWLNKQKSVLSDSMPGQRKSKIKFPKEEEKFHKTEQASSRKRLKLTSIPQSGMDTQDVQTEQKNFRPGKNPLKIIVVILGVIVILVGGYIAYMKMNSNQEESLAGPEVPQDDRVNKNRKFDNLSSKGKDTTGGKAKLPEGVPEGALAYGGHYYYVYKDGIASSYAEALQYCRNQGGYLAVLTSQEENDAVYTYMKKQGHENAYFGLSDAAAEGIWKWCTGEPMTYSNWHPGEPNGENPTEDYAMFYFKYPDGTWNDGDFDGRTVNGGHAFICEWGDYTVSQDMQDKFLKPAEPDFSTPEGVFQNYHQLITERKYSRAYDCLSSDMKNSMGSLSTWADGYKTTISSIPEQVDVVSNDGDQAELSFYLKATDRNGSEKKVQYFKGTCHLVHSGDTWLITEITAKLA